MARNRRTARLILVCEDQQQAAFARRYIKKLRNFDDRSMRVELNPKGFGSGEQFIRGKFVKEVRAHRQKTSHSPVGTILIVLIDADLYSVKERIKQLNDALEMDEQERVKDSEKIGIFVPKRNIETWIYYGRGEAVDEETAYPKLSKESHCKDSVNNYVTQICANKLPADAPTSLNHACTELGRIL